MTTTNVTIAHVHHGRIVEGGDRVIPVGGVNLLAPELDLDALVLPRSVPGPAFDLPVEEIVLFLERLGKELSSDTGGHLAKALEALALFSPLSRRVLTTCFARLAEAFERESLEFQIEQQLPIAALDGWMRVSPPETSAEIRAYPARTVQILSGNSPNVAATSISRSALTKGVHLLKLPANDPLTATAILRTMAHIDHEHPVLHSFSVAYWRGGDKSVEDVILRAQFFDKLIAWGGESAIRNALSYAAPGLEVTTFDPKMSISLIGRDGFDDEATLRDIAIRGATDVSILNQDACSSSVFQFVEASTDSVDRYCELLAAELAVDRPVSDGHATPTSADLREEIAALRDLEPAFRVWGDFDGHGIVIRSAEPVDFHPAGKVVNVIPVERLEDALRWVTVATQTVGVYPVTCKPRLRDALACRGAQRIVTLGDAAKLPPGLSHDGFMPLQHMVRWVNVQS